jgi:hypothetical protein
VCSSWVEGEADNTEEISKAKEEGLNLSASLELLPLELNACKEKVNPSR